jgi:hypothetical protein
MPIEKRVPHGFLLGLWRQLIAWRFPAHFIKVDDSEIKAGGKPILRALVADDGFKIEWLDEVWKTWDLLVNSAEFQELQGAAKEKIEASRAQMSKGVGKGAHQ